MAGTNAAGSGWACAGGAAGGAGIGAAGDGGTDLAAASGRAGWSERVAEASPGAAGRGATVIDRVGAPGAAAAWTADGTAWAALAGSGAGLRADADAAREASPATAAGSEGVARGYIQIAALAALQPTAEKANRRRKGPNAAPEARRARSAVSPSPRFGRFPIAPPVRSRHCA
jgi:hypothetical protein